MSAAPRRPRVRLWQWSRLFWQLHPPVALVLRADRAECLRVLASATKPRLDRLELRDLFSEGRRYFIAPTPQGFRLTNSARPLWGRSRRRTPIASIVTGTFADLGGSGDAITSIHLRTRMHYGYAFSALLIPAFVTSIIVPMPWGAAAVALLTIALFGFSWMAHRYNAALQAADLVYFVRKALEDLPAAPLVELGTGDDDPVIAPRDAASAEFRRQWDRYYQEQSQRD